VTESANSSPLDLETALEALRTLSAEELLLPILLQLGLIIVVARGFGLLFRRLGQPSVVGEIIAGIVLGPSLLGALFPGISQAIFQPQIHGVDPALLEVTLGWVLMTLSHLGLILLLFLIGLEFDFHHLKLNGPAALGISISGIAFPFVMGLGLAPLLVRVIEPHPEAEGPVPVWGFALFLGTALSITALPTLGRIMQELNIIRTRIGAVAISSAAVDDAAGWILLAAVAALVGGNFSAGTTLMMLGQTVAFTALMLVVARPLLQRWARRTLARHGGDLSVTALAVLLVLIFSCSLVTNRIGIFAIFGAFVLGAAFSSEAPFREAVVRRLQDLVTAFFLPIFFTYTGLRTNIGSLADPQLWLFCGMVFAVAVIGKLGGCAIAAQLGGLSWRESACIGTLMNTRGLMGLIVINVGYELKVVPASVFCMLVMMAIATTLMTTPLLLRLAPGTELEPLLKASGFLPSNPEGPPLQSVPLPTQSL